MRRDRTLVSAYLPVARRWLLAQGHREVPDSCGMRERSVYEDYKTVIEQDLDARSSFCRPDVNFDDIITNEGEVFVVRAGRFTSKRS